MAVLVQRPRWATRIYTYVAVLAPKRMVTTHRSATSPITLEDMVPMLSAAWLLAGDVLVSVQHTRVP